jgi:hypothetical protein
VTVVEWLTDGWSRHILTPGKQPIILLLAGLLASFVFIRVSTRLIRARVSWWPSNISPGGLHLHHELFGVVLMLVTGTLGFGVDTVRPWKDVLALLFGVGAGLVLDEFALLLYLKDVYWSEQGRSSLDAVVIAVVGVAMLLVGASPFGVDRISSGELTVRWTAIGVVLVNLALTIATALKGKLWTALVSVPLPVFGVVGAVRLARPASPWSRWRYSGRPDRLERAELRECRWRRRRHRLLDLVGGAPTPLGGGPADLAEALQRRRDTHVRRRRRRH